MPVMLGTLVRVYKSHETLGTTVIISHISKQHNIRKVDTILVGLLFSVLTCHPVFAPQGYRAELSALPHMP